MVLRGNTDLREEKKKSNFLLREHPFENHAVLKYRSASILSDFVQILCKVT